MSKRNVVPYLQFYPIPKFGKFWSTRRVVFHNLQIQVSLANRKAFASNRPRRVRVLPGQGSGRGPTFPPDRQAVGCLTPTCGTALAPLSLSFTYKRGCRLEVFPLPHFFSLRQGEDTPLLGAG
jgi:hypothetical protein